LPHRAHAGSNIEAQALPCCARSGWRCRDHRPSRLLEELKQSLVESCKELALK
jgi:hypothetical protein